ncbi:MAG: ribosomal RNA small subunit methyltransferase A, partial [Leptospiraceae bacterium]|nr:ribosomal RNA small subunit methyltransferase A [Leptospiraceae bacterium]
MQENPFPFFKTQSIKSILETHGAGAHKKWGQNFLVDKQMVDFIEKTIREECSGKPIKLAEIGPGLGALTHRLIDFPTELFLFEIDPVMISVLKESYSSKKNFHIFEGDVLQNIQNITVQDIYLVGNLPYYITSEIITLSLKSLKLKGAIFMVQKEFAERICREVSSISIFAGLFGEFKYLKEVSSGCFYPRPKASSALILFRPYEEPIYESLKDIQLAETFLKGLFWGKRKTLKKNLQDSPFFKELEEKI